MKSMRSLYKKLFHYVPDKRILAYFSMALSAAAVCSYMGAYWFLWQSIVSILVIPVYEKAMYDAIIVVILMILRGILNIASATCSHYLGFRLETNLRKNGLHKLLDASSSFFDHNSSGEIRKIIDDNAAETHKTVAHLIPDNVTAVMTPVLMFVLMFAIDYRLGILLILTTVIGVLQYRKMSGGTEFLSGYSAALQKMSAATVEYVRGMQIIKIFGVTVQYYKTLINSIEEYKQYVYQYSLSCKNPYVGFQVLFNVFYAFAVPAAVVFISYSCYNRPDFIYSSYWNHGDCWPFNARLRSGKYPDSSGLYYYGGETQRGHGWCFALSDGNLLFGRKNCPDW